MTAILKAACRNFPWIIPVSGNGSNFQTDSSCNYRTPGSPKWVFPFEKPNRSRVSLLCHYDVYGHTISTDLNGSCRVFEWERPRQLSERNRWRMTWENQHLNPYGNLRSNSCKGLTITLVTTASAKSAFSLTIQRVNIDHWVPSLVILICHIYQYSIRQVSKQVSVTIRSVPIVM